MSSFITSKQIIDAVANTPQVVFEITDACNLKCKYCLYGELYGAYGERHNKYLDVNISIKFLESLISLWKSNLCKSTNRHTFISFYGGEPLLNMSFIKDVVGFLNEEVSKGLNHKFTYTMTTNGILLDKYIEFFVDNKFDILISLDGNEWGNSYRTDKNGGSSFQRLTENLNYIRNAYPEYFEKFISFNSVLHNRNSLQGTVEYIKATYGKIPTVAEMNSSGIDPVKLGEFQKLYQSIDDSMRNASDKDSLLKDLGNKSRLYKALYRYFQCYSGYYHEDYLDLLRDKEPKKLPTGTCVPFSRKIFITVNGEILPCERISHDYIMGKIDGDGVSIDYDYCAKMYNSLLSKMEQLCAVCFNKKGCVQCVYNLEKDCIGKKCGGYMNKSDYQKYEEDMIRCMSLHPDIYKSIVRDSIII